MAASTTAIYQKEEATVLYMHCVVRRVGYRPLLPWLRNARNHRGSSFSKLTPLVGNLDPDQNSGHVRNDDDDDDDDA